MTGERKEKFFDLIEREQGALAGLGVKKIGLFGSAIRGEDNDASDYDVLAVFHAGEKKYKNFTALIDFLEEKLGNEVELVTKEGLSPYIGPYILEEVVYADIKP
ncbi:conserved hypothetical protein [Candidatus Desulfarcum epimagneticum]|uniref:Polymerase nucleotidyl transferase domain-containing protein n=1 Tax=uncultured Desulfobacteraceae bacterium TaxID=218296 RepID=A0A484HK58_9BACT|nr:conserved hypothetical protein [uncultured Desulfobacteraceae bacterium]